VEDELLVSMLLHYTKSVLKMTVSSNWQIEVRSTAGTLGTLGTAGTAGTLGTAGTAGTLGTLGTAGTAGTLGTAGTAGTLGTISTVGTAGTLGTVGTAGTLGTISTVGTAGTHGTLVTVGTAKEGRVVTLLSVDRQVYGQTCDVIGSVQSRTEMLKAEQSGPIREPLWNGAGQLLEQYTRKKLRRNMQNTRKCLQLDRGSSFKSC